MDLLCKGHSLKDFYQNVVIPLSLFGFGSIESLMKLPMTDLYTLKEFLSNEDVINLHRIYHYIPKTE